MTGYEHLTKQYADIRAHTGGVRDKRRFEFTFGTPMEEQAHIAPPTPWQTRILSELHFALELVRGGEGIQDGERAQMQKKLSDAMDFLSEHLHTDGCLTDQVCRSAEEKILDLSETAKTYDLIYVSHAHIDMNWMWGYQETVAATLATFRSVLHMMEEYPEFTFMQSQASVYRIVEEYDPALMGEIQKRIREGRWEVTANAWVENDKNMPDTESLLHHVSVTREYLEHTWGLDTRKIQVDFSPDTFGHSRFIPEINRHACVPYLYHCRGTEEDVILFRYRAPGGAESLVYKEPYWYNSSVNPDNGIGLIRVSEKCAGLKTGLIVYGVGDHGGGPTRRDIEKVLEMQHWPVYPAVHFGTLHAFFHAAEQVREKLPVIDHELNTIFAGCYTTQSRIKMGNRKSEVSLLDASGLSALAAPLTGTASPEETLRKAWQDVLFTHFHDILTGSCIQESREHAMGLYQDALARTQTVLGNVMREVSEKIDTGAFLTEEDISLTQSEGAGAGAGVWYTPGEYMARNLGSYAGVPNPERGAGRTRVYTVFNTAQVDREELVETTVWDYTGDVRRLEAVDAEGRILPLQLTGDTPGHYWDHKYYKVLVRVQVPALGYTTFALREKEMDQYPVYRLNDVRVDRELGLLVMENAHLRVVLDGGSGMIVSMVDRESGAELLTGPAGLYLAEAEKQTDDAWHIGRLLRKHPMDRAVSIRSCPGELRQGVEITYAILSSRATVRIWLDRDAREIRSEMEIDWAESAGHSKDMVPVLLWCVPLEGKPGTMLCDVPGGMVQREAGCMDQACLTFAGAACGGKRMDLAADCKYG